jgi:hypothetical protein
MRVKTKLLLLVTALLLAACTPSATTGSMSPAAQTGAVPSASPIKLSLGGFYGAAAGFTTR